MNKNSQILHESNLNLNIPDNQIPNANMEKEKTTLKDPNTIRSIYNTIPTEKNNLPSQHNLNNNNNFATEDRRRNRGLYIKSENSIMQTGINCISPKYQSGHYKSFSHNENSKYKENYLNSVENLKENFIRNNESPSNKSNKNKIKLGLMYNEIPRISDSKNYSPRMNQFCNSIEKSIKYYKIEPDRKNLEELIDEENQKLKNYFSNMNKFIEMRNNSMDLTNKNNKEIEKFNYPSLMDLQKMKKLKQQNLVLSGNRYMGEKYDPLNYA